MEITDEFIVRLKNDPESLSTDEISSLGEALSALSDMMEPGRILSRPIKDGVLGEESEVPTSLRERLGMILSCLATESRFVDELTREKREARQKKEREYRDSLLAEMKK